MIEAAAEKPRGGGRAPELGGNRRARRLQRYAGERLGERWHGEWLTGRLRVWQHVGARAACGEEAHQQHCGRPCGARRVVHQFSDAIARYFVRLTVEDRQFDGETR